VAVYLANERRGEKPAGSGRARGEQTGKSTASALASVLAHCVQSNALFKMSLAHVCQTNDPVGKSAPARKETDITSQTVSVLLAFFPFFVSSG